MGVVESVQCGEGVGNYETGRSGKALLAVIVAGSYVSTACCRELHPLGSFVCCNQDLKVCASLEKKTFSSFAFLPNFFNFSPLVNTVIIFSPGKKRVNNSFTQEQSS